MADFDLTQTDAQVQSILNDAQDAQGAGAQTTLTTDYIMLKDTSGNYHKILKDSFTEACRNVLAGLLVNNDKGTTISQIPAIASGDFGSVTPANLASVLGAQIQGINITDFNDVPIGRWVFVAADSSALHAPNIGANEYRGYLHYNYAGVSTYAEQVYIDTQIRVMCFRTRNSLEWSSWQIVSTDMPSFYKDYSTLAELKAALAAV